MAHQKAVHIHSTPLAQPVGTVHGLHSQTGAEVQCVHGSATLAGKAKQWFALGMQPPTTIYNQKTPVPTCRSFMGFQSCSRKMTVSAAVRLRPRPPTWRRQRGGGGQAVGQQRNTG